MKEATTAAMLKHQAWKLLITGQPCMCVLVSLASLLYSFLVGLVSYSFLVSLVSYSFLVSLVSYSFL